MHAFPHHFHYLWCPVPPIFFVCLVIDCTILWVWKAYSMVHAEPAHGKNKMVMIIMLTEAGMRAP